MAKAQHVPLNGAYYGPSIPPPRSYSRHGGSRGCCCGCCLLRLLLKLVITVVIIIGTLALIGWLVFRPSKVKFHVTEATLTQFNLSANSSLHYNLTLDLSIRNPNRRLSIYYDRVEARPYYHDRRFDSVFLEPFHQGKKNTTDLHVSFHGQSFVQLGSSDLASYQSERTAGVYEIDVKLYLRVRFKFWSFKSPRVKPDIECGLKIPVSRNGTRTAPFQTTQCDVDF